MMDEIIAQTKQEVEDLELKLKKIEEEKEKYLKELEDVRNIFATHIKTGEIVDYTKYLADIASVQKRYPKFSSSTMNDTTTKLDQSERDLEGQEANYREFNTQDHGVAAAIDVINGVKNDVKNVGSNPSIVNTSSSKVIDNTISFELPKEEKKDNTIEFPTHLDQHTEPELSSVSFVDDIPLSTISSEHSDDNSLEGLESLFSGEANNPFVSKNADLNDNIFRNDPLSELRELNSPSKDISSVEDLSSGRLKVTKIEDTNELVNEESDGRTLRRAA